MKNMKISLKLIVSFLIVAALAAIVGVVGIIGMSQISKADTELYNMNLIAVSAMGDLNSDISLLRLHYRNFVIYPADHPSFKASEKAINELTDSADNHINEYQNTITDDEDQERFNQIRYIFNNILIGQAVPLIHEAGLRNDSEGSRVLLEKYTDPIKQLEDLVTESVEYNTQIAEDAVHNNQKLFQTMTIVAVIVLVIAVVIAMALGTYISSLISKPLISLTAFMRRAGTTGDIAITQEDEDTIGKFAQIKDEVGQCIGSTAKFIYHLLSISKNLEAVANGDLTAELTLLSQDDVMGVSLKKMTDNLNSMFSDIRTASDQVSSGANQVSQGAQGLASGSSEQAASIEELSASLTELQEKTDHNAEDSTKAQEANNKTSKKLEDSIRSMGQMLDAMKEIDDSSSSITKVIKVIDDIAFQTNILALNAAVEAARAGQHGKGFAVVADEVRNLAAKSAEAAKETAVLIEGSSERVKEGNQIVAKTNADLEAAVNNARESTRLIEQVAAASIGQAKSIAEINQGMEQISTVVQANSATAEQSAAASEEMSAQAVVLNEIVAKFKLTQDDIKRSSHPDIAVVTGQRTQNYVRSVASGFSLSSGKY